MRVCVCVCVLSLSEQGRERDDTDIIADKTSIDLDRIKQILKIAR